MNEFNPSPYSLMALRPLNATRRRNRAQLLFAVVNGVLAVWISVLIGTWVAHRLGYL